MKKFTLALVLGLLLMSNVQTANAMGFFYTDAQYPVTATGIETKDLKKLKMGESKALNVLWCVEVGDAGVYAAAKSANIKQIHFIDVREKTVFFFFRRIRTYVYGE